MVSLRGPGRLEDIPDVYRDFEDSFYGTGGFELFEE
jgi:hypothetical protein